MKNFDEASTLPLDEKIDHLCKILDGTIKSPNADRPLIPLIAVLQVSLVPIKGISGASDAERSYKGAKAWLQKSNVTEEESERIMQHVAKEAPWLVGALATEPAANSDIKYIIQNGNSYAKAGEPGEFANNYKQEAQLIAGIREEFLTLVSEPGKLEASTAQLKGMQDRVLGQVMKSSLLVIHSEERSKAIGRTIENERERLERDNPALLAEYEGKFRPAYQGKVVAPDIIQDRRDSGPEMSAEPKVGFFTQVKMAWQRIKDAFSAMLPRNWFGSASAKDNAVTIAQTDSLDVMRNAQGKGLESPEQGVFTGPDKRQNHDLRAMLGGALTPEERASKLNAVGKASTLAASSTLDHLPGQEATISHNLPRDLKIPSPSAERGGVLH